ncbi:MAG: hypothetical protein EA409_11820 [Saprospirales bacterium]|nr:MAG: hypothetical protein EA409_11820 [Saprospirales bacterium]
MRKPFTLICSMLLFFSGISAQNGASIQGLVQDSDGQNLSWATIALYNSEDSSLAKVEYSGEDGNFYLNGLNEGLFFMQINYVGLSPATLSDIKLNKGESMDLGTISMGAAGTELGEVVVTTTRPLIEMRSDRTVFNVESSVTAAGSDGLELLRRAPGVTLDNNNNIQIRGKSGVIVQIDGKTSFLNSEELANLLRSLNASDIERIEVITNPSARYDASGNSGILNIVMKKERGMGTNGAISLSGAYGRQYSANTSLNLNHRNQRFNIFGNLGGGHSRWENGLDLYRRQNERIFDQSQRQVGKSNPVNGRVGMDFFINSRHTIGILASGNSHFGDGKWDSNSRTVISAQSQPSMVDSILVAGNKTTSNRLNTSFNLNYRFVDAENGRELTIDADRAYFRNRNDAYQPNRYFNFDESELLSENNFRTRAPSTINIHSLKADFDQKLNDQLSFATGFKYTGVETDNDFNFFRILEDGEEMRDAARSNQFIYDEKVSAAYLSISGTIVENLSFQSGLRMEHTRSTGDLRRDPGQEIDPEDLVKRSYSDWFPNATLNWQINPMHGLGLSYSRRINRPNYQELNPFEWRIDELTFRKGSPFLRPYYSNSYELRYLAFQMVSVTAGYTKTKDRITDIVEASPTEPDKSFINYRNLSTQNHYSLGLSSPTPIQPWWNGFININIYKTQYIAEFPEYSFDVSTPVAVNLYAEQNFSISPSTIFEISGWYNSSAIWGGGWVTDPQGSLNIGLQHRMFNNQATLKVSFTDLLNTAAWSSRGEAVPGLVVDGGGYWDSRQFRVNFNYRFGNQEVRANRQRRTGIEAEKGRIGE